MTIMIEWPTFLTPASCERISLLFYAYCTLSIRYFLWSTAFKRFLVRRRVISHDREPSSVFYRFLAISFRYVSGLWYEQEHSSSLYLLLVSSFCWFSAKRMGVYKGRFFAVFLPYLSFIRMLVRELLPALFEIYWVDHWTFSAPSASVESVSASAHSQRSSSHVQNNTVCITLPSTSNFIRHRTV